MGTLEVRELAAGDVPLWLELDREMRRDGDPSKADRAIEFRKHFEERSAEDPRVFLLAMEGSRPAGRLEGVFLDKRSYLVINMLCAEGFPCSPVEDALVGYLAPSFSRDGIVVFSSDRPKNAEINNALTRAGFEIEKRKAFVERGLEGALPEPAVEFEFRTLFDAGKVEFLRIMTEAAEGDPFEDVTGRDPEADFNELVEAAGSAFDPAGWMIAHVGSEAVGVVLPQEFADNESEGTLFYVAVLPAFRGRGYGRALHASGLAMLARRGVTHYIGSTDTRNEPMLRVFEANGCRQTATRFFYRAPAGTAGR